MRGHPTVFVLTLVLLLSAGTARAGIEACAAVRDGRAEAVFLHQDPTPPGSPNVGAVLKRPAGPGPHPAMIVLHGNGGLRAPRCYEGALDLLVGWGYAALAVDSHTGRIAQGGYSFAEQSADAVRALAWLQQRPEIDAARIGIIGWSRGGLAALATITDIEGNERTDTGPTFPAAVAFYPICIAKTVRLKSNLLVLIGAEDRITPVRPCRAMQVRPGRFIYELKVYPGARHVFDARWHPHHDPTAARDALVRTEAFLATHLMNR